MVRRGSRLLAVIWLILVVSACGSGQGSSGGTGGNGSNQLIALLEPGVKNDLSWNQVAYEGATAAVNTQHMRLVYTDNIGYAAQDAARFARLYAQQGAKLVIAHNSSYKDGILQVAKEFPNVDFVYQDDGTVQTAANVSGYNMDIYQAAYLGGVVAGGMTKTGVLGAVGGLAIPFCFAYFNAFLDGAKTVNPKVKLETLYTSNFGDIQGAKSAGETLADRQADVLVPCGDGAARGLIQVAAERSLLALGYMHDMSVLAPLNVVASIDWNAEKSYAMILHDLVSGHFRPTKHYDFNLANGTVGLDINPSLAGKVPQSVTTQIQQDQAAAAAGKLNIQFNGATI